MYILCLSVGVEGGRRVGEGGVALGAGQIGD